MSLLGFLEFPRNAFSTLIMRMMMAIAEAWRIAPIQFRKYVPIFEFAHWRVTKLTIDIEHSFILPWIFLTQNLHLGLQFLVGMIQIPVISLRIKI